MRNWRPFYLFIFLIKNQNITIQGLKTATSCLLQKVWWFSYSHGAALHHIFIFLSYNEISHSSASLASLQACINADIHGEEIMV